MRGYVLAVFLGLLAAARLWSEAALRWEFLVWIAAGLALRFWAGAHLGSHGNASRARAPVLRRGGPYRFSRNPLYLSNILAGTGMLFFAHCLPPPLEALAALLLCVHHALLVQWEERNLRAQWGEAYIEYTRATPRWLGFSRSAVSDNGNPADWKRVWAWQGRNLAYSVLSVLLLGWAAWK